MELLKKIPTKCWDKEEPIKGFCYTSYITLTLRQPSHHITSACLTILSKHFKDTAWQDNLGLWLCAPAFWRVYLYRLQ